MPGLTGTWEVSVLDRTQGGVPDISGEWEISTVCDESQCGGSGSVLTAATATIVQDCDFVELFVSGGGYMTGTIAGGALQIFRTYPEDGGTTTEDITLVVGPEGETLIGSSSWNWDDGQGSCGGSCSYSANRIEPPESEFDVDIVQSGSSVTLTLPNGTTYSGSIQGDQLTISATFPEDGGTTTADLSATLSPTGWLLSGTNSWSWTDGTYSCAGESDFEAFRPIGRVLWGPPGSSEVPGKSIGVRAYRIVSAGTPQREFLSSSTSVESDVEGYFVVPSEFFTTPVAPNEQLRGLCAEFDYDEPGALPSVPRTIRNYPEWSPFDGAMVSSGLDEDQLRERAQHSLRTEIHVPFPVVFQPGVMGTASTAPDGSAYQLRATLIADSWDDPVKLVDRTPAFPFFCMPSNDDVSYGYSNLSAQDVYDGRLGFRDEILENAAMLDLHLVTRVREQLLPHMDLGGSALRFSLLAHSYGGLISRAWLRVHSIGGWSTSTGQPSSLMIARPECYVTFDAAHGGTAVAFLPLVGFSEKLLNGTSPSFAAPPLPGWRGFNYSISLSRSGNTLLFSNAVDWNPTDPSTFGDGIISPFSSAFGVGRMILAGTYASPSGYCKEFVGGHRCFVNATTHSLQRIPAVAYATAEFLANRKLPSPAEWPIFAWVDSTSSWTPQPPSACSVTVHGSLGSDASIEMSSPLATLAGSTATIAIAPNEAGTLLVEGFLSGPGATLHVLDGAGAPLPRSSDGSQQVLGGVQVQFTVDTTSGGGEFLQLVAGTDDALFFGTFQRPGRPALLVNQPASRIATGDPVPVEAQLNSPTGTPLLDFGGSVFAELQGPDPRATVLNDDGLGMDLLANDGVYSGSIPPAWIPGNYKLVVTSLGTSTQFGSVARRSVDPIQVATNDTWITGLVAATPMDEDNDGLFDRVDVELGVVSNATGAYHLSGEVRGGGTSRPVSAVLDVATAPSTGSVHLSLDASVIRDANGSSLTLEELSLEEFPAGASFTTALDVFLGTFDPAAFEPEPAPSLLHLLPSTGHPGDLVRLRGSRLEGATGVLIGDRACSFTVVSHDTIEVLVPTMFGSTGAGGSFTTQAVTARGASLDVTVETSGGTATLSRAFTYAGVPR